MTHLKHILFVLIFSTNSLIYAQCPAIPACTQTANSGASYTLAAGDVLCVNSSYTAGTININGGVLIIQSGGTISGGGSAINMSAGTIHIASGGTLSKDINPTGASSINNCGTVSGTRTFNSNMTLNNYAASSTISLKYGGNIINNYAADATITFGTVDVTGGILNNYGTNLKFSINSSWNNGITFNNAAAATMEVVSVPGSMPGSTVVNNAGAFTYTPVLNTTGATFTNALGATLNFTSSAAANKPNITNNGTMNVSGTFYLAGGTTNNNGTMTYSDELRLDGGTLNLNKNSKTTTKTLYKNSGTINMDDHSLMTIQQNITSWSGGAINLISGCATVMGSTMISNNSINSNLLSSPNLNFCGSAPMQAGGCTAIPLSVSDNGSGAYRITGLFPCGINNLDYIEINGTVGVPDLNGYWRVNKVSTVLGVVTLDLIGSTYVNGSIFTLTSILYTQGNLKFGNGNYLGYSSCTNPCAPLPVTLLSFNAYKESGAVKIEWQTIEEKNNRYYEVQRSVDGIHYETIATVEGNRNSSSLLTYTEYDRSPYSGTSYYRLKQVDLNGTIAYSNIAVVEINTLSDWTVYPNPSIDGSFTIASSFGEDEVIAVLVTDVTGNRVRYYSSESYENEMHVSDLSSGLYIVTIQTLSETRSKKLIVR